MTEQEAKDWLKAISCTMIDGVCLEQRKEALFMGMQALEKQIAKKLHNYYCPICRYYFEDGEPHKYCPECGQRLGE